TPRRRGRARALPRAGRGVPPQRRSDDDRGALPGWRDRQGTCPGGAAAAALPLPRRLPRGEHPRGRRPPRRARLAVLPSASAAAARLVRVRVPSVLPRYRHARHRRPAGRLPNRVREGIPRRGWLRRPGPPLHPAPVRGTRRRAGPPSTAAGDVARHEREQVPRLPGRARPARVPVPLERRALGGPVVPGAAAAAGLRLAPRRVGRRGAAGQWGAESLGIDGRNASVWSAIRAMNVSVFPPYARAPLVTGKSADVV